MISENKMRGIFILVASVMSLAAMLISGGIMLHDLMLPVFDGAHFAGAAVATSISAIFFWFIQDEVVC